MSRDIAFYGDFSLRYKTYICEHNYTTHDIEIVKWYEDNGKKYCYTIANWSDDKKPNLVSCGTRLIDEIKSMDDLEAVHKLAKIGKLILSTDPAPINLD